MSMKIKYYAEQFIPVSPFSIVPKFTLNVSNSLAILVKNHKLRIALKFHQTDEMKFENSKHNILRCIHMHTPSVQPSLSMSSLSFPLSCARCEAFHRIHGHFLRGVVIILNEITTHRNNKRSLPKRTIARGGQKIPLGIITDVITQFQFPGTLFTVRFPNSVTKSGSGRN